MIYGFFRNAGVMVVAEMVARLKGLIVLPLLTRYLGPLDYGVWTQVSVITLLLSPVLSLGAEQGLSRMLPGLDTERQFKCFLGWMLIALGGAVIAAALLLAANSAITHVFFAVQGYEAFVALAAASLFTTLLPNAARIWLRIRNDANTLALATVGQALLGVVVVVAAIMLKVGSYSLIALTLLADFLLGLALLVLIVHRHGWKQPSCSIIPAAIRFGLPLLPAAYAIWGLNWVDRLFLVQYEKLETIGIYSVAYGLGYMIMQLFVNPIWSLYPNSAAVLHNKGDHAGVDKLLHTISASILVLSLPAIAGMWVLGEPLIVLIAGDSFRAGAAVMPVIALGYLLLMLASFGDVALGLAYRQHLSTLSMAVAFVVNCALNFLLVPRFGMMGAALATLAAFSVQLAISSIFAARCGPFWHSFSVLYRVVAASALMAAVLKSFDTLVAMPDMMRLVVLVPTGVALYAAMALTFGVVPYAYVRQLRARLLHGTGFAP